MNAESSDLAKCFGESYDQKTLNVLSKPHVGEKGMSHNLTNSRLANGVAAASVCDTPAATVSKRFISIEQAPGHYRDPAHWIAALTAAFPR